MSFNKNTCYKKPDDVVARTNQDGTFVVMKMDDSNVFFKINGVAADVWKGLLEGKTPEALIGEIEQSYESPRDVIEADVSQFITELLGKDLLAPV
jgi:hypothetical protein